jgi:hypothetical protein
VRFILSLILILAIVAPVSAGVHDASVWSKWDGGKTTVIPWYVYSGPHATVDTRFNFDQRNTFALFLGKSFAKGKLSITPYLGGMVGDYSGTSAQLNFFVSSGKKSLFVMNQYAWMDRSPNFAYHWADGLVQINKHLALGFDEQAYKEPRGDWYVDVGPVAKVSVGHAYLKAWGTIDPGHDWDRKFFIGIGYAP